ncbi:hypothetical protein AAG570_004349 [Ranatra chinensis]|uniref:Glucose-methanol-choline oxidoreductase N-terminal domain-containing protein n=1 Tax=Ranatra chinensis TaxID=642074 RepID=A0ABD0Y0N3_9HEMI
MSPDRIRYFRFSSWEGRLKLYGFCTGCVVASRLSEEEGWKVLLIETGPRDDAVTRTPRLMPYGLTRSGRQHTTVEQKKACRGENSGFCSEISARILGGGSSINPMIYARGNRRVFDCWASAGNPGWSYEEVLPYFKKSEDQRNAKYAADKKYHGTGGYLTVGEPSYFSPMKDLLMEGMSEMGLPEGDLNGEVQYGAMAFQGTIGDGRRASTSRAFLRPAKDRPNLHVITLSTVTKLLFDESGSRAVGVEYTRGGKTRKVSSSKEVILSVGTYQSPRLLMVSGVGPREELAELGIPTVKDLPVGRYLVNHPSVYLKFEMDRRLGIGFENYSTPDSIEAYAKASGGVLGTSTVEAIALVNSSFADESYPDIQLIMLSVNPIIFAEDDPVWWCIAVATRPQSRGSLRLASAHEEDEPLIDPRFLEEESDAMVLAEGVDRCLRLARTRPMRRHHARFLFPDYEECSHLGRDFSPAYLRCLATFYSSSALHPVGTCRMGPANDSQAVVDPRLRVYGIQNLRVIDASVMPEIVNTNTNAATIMIAEKGADMVKDDWMRQTPAPGDQGGSADVSRQMDDKRRDQRLNLTRPKQDHQFSSD